MTLASSAVGTSRIALPLLLLSQLASGAEPVRPLVRAHAHNDYYHQRPLLDALSEGFCSIEADVFEVDGALLIGHDRDELRSERTLQELYLRPLWDRVRANGGRVYRDGPELTLLIDFKSAAERTYRVLRRELEPYHEMLTVFHPDRIEQRAVRIVISGNRPWETVADEPVRHVAIDGRLRDLHGDRARTLMPLISDNWRNHFAWRGEGPLPPPEQAKLQRVVEQAHQQGWRIRFWATPDRESVWRALAEAGVDHINTDDLAGLGAFLRGQANSSSAGREPGSKESP